MEHVVRCGKVMWGSNISSSIGGGERDAATVERGQDGGEALLVRLIAVLGINNA